MTMAAIMELRKRMGLATEPGMIWPPIDDSARIRDYRDYRRVFEGNHRAVFAKNNRDFVSVNIPRNIVTVTSDLLFGEDFELEFQDTVPEAAQEQLGEMLDRTEFVAMMHESSLDCGHAGDVVFIVSRGDDGLARFHPQCPEMWFPELDGDDQRVVKRHRFAWEREDEGGNKFIRMTIHEPGTIHNQLWLYRDGMLVREATPDEWRRFYDEIPPEAIDTGVDEMLVVHIPNFRTARDFFGYSEYRGVMSMFDSLDAVVTQIDRVLSKNTDPILGLPEQTFAALNTLHNGRIPKDNLDIVALGPNGEKPEYVTWDGRVEDNLAFVHELVMQIANVTETSPQLLGVQDMGGGMSGRALKILLLRTLSKVGRRRRYYEAGIQRLLYLAQLVEGTEPVKVNIKWPDGLPQDAIEDGQIAAERIASGTLSRLTAITRLDGVDEDTAQDELDQIDAEQDATRNDPALQQNLARPGQQPGVSVTVGDLTRV